ncbi:MAG: oxidative stress defense protein [Methanoregula sp. PtaU1.Bin051]|nr:MAG: oxidative stress defense protein [Methanoregula sp. PtaU1.Bin051]
MKQRMFILSVVLLIAVATLAGTASAALLGGDDREIHATGTGSVIGTPDRAQISLAIETQNTDVKTAQLENAARMTQVIDSLVAAGIPRDALKTTGYTIYPVYDYPEIYTDKSGSERKIQSYRVTNTLTVTLHDVNRVGDVIDVGVASGVNQASSIRFMLSDEQSQALRTEALKEAVARADADAKTVASALHVAVGSVKNVEIAQGFAPVLFENYAGLDMKSAAGTTPIEPGDVTVTATVTITYLIR